MKYIELEFANHITILADKAAKATKGHVDVIEIPTVRKARPVYTITELGKMIGSVRMTKQGRYSILLNVKSASQDALNAFTLGCTQEFS